MNPLTAAKRTLSEGADGTEELIRELRNRAIGTSPLRIHGLSTETTRELESRIADGDVAQEFSVIPISEGPVRRRTLSEIPLAEFIEAWKECGGYGARVARHFGISRNSSVCKRARNLGLEVRGKGRPVGSFSSTPPKLEEIEVLEGRMTQAEAGRRLGITKSAVHLRVKRLRAQGWGASCGEAGQ